MTEVLTGPACRSLFAHLTHVVEGKRRVKPSVLTSDLLGALAAYRNRTHGHGATREDSFYANGVQELRAALEEMWDGDVFLPSRSRLVYTTNVQSDATDGTRAFALDLTGEAPFAERPDGESAPATIRPSNVYLRCGDEWRDLHPWLVFDDHRERLYCFQALKRRPDYLDFVSGEWLGDALEILAPGTTELLRARLGDGVLPAEKPSTDKREFGEFLRFGVLGEGGMGEVHLAEQRSLGRLVALKVLPRHTARNPSALARFQREIEALGRCEHPNLVKIFESGVERGEPYYAMEYVQGVDLRDIANHLRGRESFDDALATAWEAQCASHAELKTHLPQVDVSSLREPRGEHRQRRIATIVRDASLGVQDLHEHGIVHRDISPANIAVTVPDRRAVVMDLGLASLEGHELSRAQDRTKVFGTLRYMAPEQIEGSMPADRRTDVYGLGAVLYELLSDGPLFDGDSQGHLMRRIVETEPKRLAANAKIDRDLALITEKALAKEPELRYRTAADLATDLTAYLDGRPISARAATPGYLLQRWVQRNKLLSTSVAAGMIGVMISVSIAIGQWLTARHEEYRGNLLSDARTAKSLREKSRDLPADPTDTREARNLIRTVEELRSKLPQHAGFVEQQRRDAGADSSAGSIAHAASGDAESDKRDGATVSRWEIIKMYSGLNADLSALGDDRAGEIARIRRQSDEFDALERVSILEHRADWEAASETLAQDARFKDHALRPLLGLVPLGQDPDSRLLEFWHVLSGARPLRDSSTSQLGKPLPGDGIVLVLVPGGVFNMGAQAESPNNSNFDPLAHPFEAPVRPVRLDPFLISKYEVTEEQWLRLAGTYSGTYGPDGRHEARRTNGVHGLQRDESWWILKRFLLGCPTEAQWEYCARAGTRSRWFFGNEMSELGSYGNVADRAFQESIGGSGWPHDDVIDDGYGAPAPAGSFCPNSFGLYDTIGGFMEWVEDDYAEDAYKSNPLDGRGYRGVQSNQCIARGGQWAGVARFSRSSHRYGVVAGVEAMVGIRPVYGPQPCLHEERSNDSMYPTALNGGQR